VTGVVEDLVYDLFAAEAAHRQQQHAPRRSPLHVTSAHARPPVWPATADCRKNAGGRAESFCGQFRAHALIAILGGYAGLT
jgi:hypothetical protein